MTKHMQIKEQTTQSVRRLYLHKNQNGICSSQNG